MAKITLYCNLLKTKGDFGWLGVRDGIRNWIAEVRGQLEFKVTEAHDGTRRHFDRGCNSP